MITDNERQLFGITDAPLKNAVEKYFGKLPNDAYVRSPTPWNDLYKLYGWDQVTAVLTVNNATIVGVSSQSTIIDGNSFCNISPISATFNVPIQNSFTNTYEDSWITDGISFDQTISYEVGFMGTKGGRETKFGFSAQFGSGGSRSTEVMVGLASSFTVELGPNQAFEAVHTVTRSELKARITYTVSLTGLTVIHYNPGHQHEGFMALPIVDVMRAGGLSNLRQITEDIDIVYYSNGKVEMQKSCADLKNVATCV